MRFDESPLLLLRDELGYFPIDNFGVRAVASRCCPLRIDRGMNLARRQQGHDVRHWQHLGTATIDRLMQDAEALFIYGENMNDQHTH